jgi:hypothetical protein
MIEDVVKVDPTTLKPDPLNQTHSPGGGTARRKKPEPAPETETAVEPTPQADEENPPHLLDVRA